MGRVGERDAENAGLRGCTVGRTAICSLGGDEQGPSCRGYSIEALAEEASFEETAWLLLYGDLPDERDLAAFRERLRNRRRLPEPLTRLLEVIPADAPPIDVLRTGVSMLGTLEPEAGFDGQDDVAERLLALMPGMVAHWYRFTHYSEHVEPGGMESTAEQIIQGVTGRSGLPGAERALDAALILYAGHELDASTFACRVCASTLADMYACVTCGVSTLGGLLHGGATEAVMALIRRFPGPDEAADGVRRMLSRQERITGFGHAAWRDGDPRTPIMQQWSKSLAEIAPDGRLHTIAETIDQVVREETGLYPDPDYYSATTFHFIGIPTALFTPILTCARVSGWCAHIKEQRADNHLIRPDAEYTGPADRPFVPLEQR